LVKKTWYKYGLVLSKHDILWSVWYAYSACLIDIWL